MTDAAGFARGHFGGAADGFDFEGAFPGRRRGRMAPVDSFDGLWAAFQGTGGLARGDDLAKLLGDHDSGEPRSLSAMVLEDRIFGFDHSNTFWVPMFQFQRESLRLDASAGKVRAELGTTFDGLELASWFAEPNVWLRHRAPVDLLHSHLARVVAAARTDRFVAAG